VAFSRDGRRLAAASFDNHIQVWDWATRELVHSFCAHAHLALGLAFSADGRRLATAGADETVKIWDALTARELLTFRAPALMRHSVAFSPDGWRLASADLDGVIRLWDATPLRGKEGQGLLTFPQSMAVWAMAASSDGRWIAASGENFHRSPGRPAPPVNIWEISSGKLVHALHGHSIIVFSVAFSPDGRYLASVGDDAQRPERDMVIVWDLTTGRKAFEVEGGNDRRALFDIAFSPDGSRLVAAGEKKVLSVWDAATGRLIGVLGEHDRECIDLAFSRDGAQLASVSAHGTIKIWDGQRLDQPQEARLILPLGTKIDIADSLAFSPNGERLIVANEGDAAPILDTMTGEQVSALRGRRGDLLSAVFSPDGQWIASGGADCSVRVWDVKTGEPIHTFRGHKGRVHRVAFLFGAGGKRLVLGSKDGTVKIWDLDSLKDQRAKGDRR
jgi:WD40 repeat protein